MSPRDAINPPRRAPKKTTKAPIRKRSADRTRPFPPPLNHRLCVIAGDISPIDVITHIPILCEESNVPYIYVHSKEELGAAGQTKRPTSCMLVLPDAQKGGDKMSDDDAKEFKDMYGKVVSKIKSLD